METVHKHLWVNYSISENHIRQLGIDPKKQWVEITLNELDDIANYLSMSIPELTGYTL